MGYGKKLLVIDENRDAVNRQSDGSPKMPFWKFFIIVFILFSLFAGLMMLLSGIFYINHPEIYMRGSDIDTPYYYDFDENSINFSDDNESTKESNIRLRQSIDGLYNATDTFDSYDLGTFETQGNWTVDDSGGAVEILDDWYGHSDILYIKDNSAAERSSVYYNFTTRAFGTYEFWYQTGHPSSINYLLTTSSTGLIPIYFKIEADYFQYYDGGWVSMAKAESYTWYHISIDFECGNGGYAGLSADTCSIRINGKPWEVMDFYQDCEALTQLTFYTNPAQTCYMYVDALGLSWRDYDVSDNAECGMYNTTTYEVDKQCWHQVNYSNTVYDYKTSGTSYDNGYLSWNTNIGVGGSIEYYTGAMDSPETDDNYKNMYVRVKSTTNSPTGTVEFTRNFTNQVYNILELECDFTYFAGDLYKWSVFRFYNKYGSGLPFFQTSSNGDNTYKLLVFDPDLDPYEFNSSVPIANEFYMYMRVSGCNAYYYAYDKTDDIEYELSCNIFNPTPILSQVMVSCAGTTNNFINVDNIGVKIDGISLIDNEFGYAEMNHPRLSEIHRADMLVQGNVCISNTQPASETRGYICNDDTLIYIYNHSSSELETVNMILDYDSMILTLNANETFEQSSISLTLNDIYIRNNSILDSYIESTYETGSFNTSRFYSEYNYLNSYCYSTDGILQSMTAIFNLTNFDATNTTLYVNDIYRSSWLFGIEFRVYFTDNTYYRFELDDSDNYQYDGSNWKGSLAGYIPDYKTIDYINFTIHPTIDCVNTFVYAGLRSMEFRPIYDTPFDLDNLHNTGILSILVPIIALLVPSFIIPYGLEKKREGMAKKTFVPIFVIFSVILFATGTLPAWLFFVCLIAGGTLIFVMRQGGTTTNINLGVSLQAKKDKLAVEKKKKKDRDFKQSFKYEMAKYKAISKKDKFQTKQYKKQKRQMKKTKKGVKKV